MFIRKIIAGMLLSGSLVVSTPVLAQDTSIDTSAISTACATGGGACVLAVQAAIAALQALGLPAAALNEQLGVVASAVVDASSDQPASVQAAAASALREVSAASTDPDQQQALNEAATSLDSGESVEVAAVAAAPGASENTTEGRAGDDAGPISNN